MPHSGPIYRSLEQELHSITTICPILARSVRIPESARFLGGGGRRRLGLAAKVMSEWMSEWMSGPKNEANDVWTRADDLG